MTIDETVARQLGVTPVGLKMLAYAVAHDGFARGYGGKNPGTARERLIRQGYVTSYDPTAEYYHTITDAGRDLVRRARAMGW